MAVKTPCQTSGAVYGMSVRPSSATVHVDFGRDLSLTQQDVQLLEANLHNAVELALAPFFIARPSDD
jgi:hypothetical protein